MHFTSNREYRRYLQSEALWRVSGEKEDYFSVATEISSSPRAPRACVRLDIPFGQVGAALTRELGSGFYYDYPR